MASRGHVVEGCAQILCRSPEGLPGLTRTLRGHQMNPVMGADRFYQLLNLNRVVRSQRVKFAGLWGL